MPNEPQNIRSFLEDRQAALLAALRRKAPEEITEYLKVTAAIAAVNSTAETIVVDEYRGIRKPLDAVDTYLKNKGLPAPRKVIAKVLEEGGFAKDEVQRPYWNVLSAIEYNLKSSKDKRIKEVNGLIGKIEWPDAMFIAIQEEKE